MEDYTKYNAQNVLNKAEELLNNLYYGSYRIDNVYEDLSIFDWWVDRLTKTHLKQMISFLKFAIKNGFRGYVCFKVGAEGCSSGMWASKEASTDGSSPDGDCLYRSFSPSYTYYSVEKDGIWYPDGNEYNSIKNQNQMQKLLVELYGGKYEKE